MTIKEDAEKAFGSYIQPNGRIVCHQDIVQWVKFDPLVTSDELAASLGIGIRLQDVLLEMVKRYVEKVQEQ